MQHSTAQHSTAQKRTWPRWHGRNNEPRGYFQVSVGRLVHLKGRHQCFPFGIISLRWCLFGIPGEPENCPGRSARTERGPTLHECKGLGPHRWHREGRHTRCRTNGGRESNLTPEAQCCFSLPPRRYSLLQCGLHHDDRCEKNGNLALTAKRPVWWMSPLKGLSAKLGGAAVPSYSNTVNTCQYNTRGLGSAVLD